MHHFLAFDDLANGVWQHNNPKVLDFREMPGLAQQVEH